MTCHACLASSGWGMHKKVPSYIIHYQANNCHSQTQPQNILDGCVLNGCESFKYRLRIWVSPSLYKPEGVIKNRSRKPDIANTIPVLVTRTWIYFWHFGISQSKNGISNSCSGWVSLGLISILELHFKLATHQTALVCMSIRAVCSFTIRQPNIHQNSIHFNQGNARFQKESSGVKLGK